MTDRANDSPAAVLPGVWERLGERLRRVCRNRGVPAEDAADLVQDALVLALERWAAIDNVEAWLVGTLERKCVMYWRRRLGREEAYARFVVSTRSLRGEVAEDGAAVEARVDLERLMRSIGSHQGRCVLWHYGCGLSPAAAAQRVGYSGSGGRKIVGRALAACRHRARTGGRRHEPRRRIKPQARRTGGSWKWTGECVKLLGTMSDRKLAKRLRVSTYTVWKERQRRGIPPFEARQKYGIRWTEEMIAQLGTGPDSEVAGRLGISLGSVWRKRFVLGIPAFGCRGGRSEATAEVPL